MSNVLKMNDFVNDFGSIWHLNFKLSLFFKQI